MNTLIIVIAIILALIHLFAGRLRFLSYIPRSNWLSFAGGVSVTYVFLHLLPELQEHQEFLREDLSEPWSFIEHHIYLIALIGLAVFYGLERLAIRSRQEQAQDTTSPEVFWIHIGSFAVYNLLIGYLLLHREESTTASLIAYAIAMGLHFIVNDLGLRHHHQAMYHQIGRWILSGSVLLGACLGYFIEIQRWMIIILVALLAGGVILNILKEELPEERESRFWAFGVGIVSYSVLLLAF